MKALILDTSGSANFLILAEEGRLVFSCPLSEGPLLSKRLPTDVKEALEKASFQKVDTIFVAKGPGSATSLRVGASFAKGLAFGWQVPLFGFSRQERSFEKLAELTLDPSFAEGFSIEYLHLSPSF